MDKSANRAVVVGVGQYPPPIRALPAVAADVREMAKVLQSKDGRFSKSQTVVLSDKQATKSAVELSLSTAFGANADDTAFIYLAGHGEIENGEYYFVPYDANSKDLKKTGVPLKWIKDQFDRCKSNRLFLWLDCCRSGGILQKRSIDDDVSVVKRTLQVVSGHGRVIIAACTPEQSAYEDPVIGHGLFTHALLRGLKGEAAQQGEVTAGNLYEFIDRQITRDDQRPMLFGEMRGRIVLMHFDSAVLPKKGPGRSAKKKPAVRGAKSNVVMLGNNFFKAKTVRRLADGNISVEIQSKDAEHDARIKALQPTAYQRNSIPFAFGNDAFDAEVKEITSETSGSVQNWTLSVKPNEFKHNSFSDGSYSFSGQHYGPEDIAELRAKVILLDDRLPVARGFSSSSMVKHTVEQTPNGEPMPCAVRSAYASHRKTAIWKEIAKLTAIYLLKSTRTVEHILELKIGAVRGGKVSVRFRGRRHSIYSNADPVEIAVNGECSLA